MAKAERVRVMQEMVSGATFFPVAKGVNLLLAVRAVDLFLSGRLCD